MTKIVCAVQGLGLLCDATQFCQCVIAMLYAGRYDECVVHWLWLPCLIVQQCVSGHTQNIYKQQVLDTPYTPFWIIVT